MKKQLLYNIHCNTACHSCERRNPRFILLISIATTFKSWATITEQFMALAKCGFSGLAKAKISLLISPRPKGRCNSTLLSLNQN